MWTKLFQSTLPVRGATIKCLITRRTYRISIHAPREGSDFALLAVDDLGAISIHAPREGSDEIVPERYAKAMISIHAPREGSDWGLDWRISNQSNFNPRSP